MKQVELKNTVKMISMLQYLGCRDIGLVFENISFWKFPMIIASHYVENGELTTKQKEVMINIIKDKVGVDCVPYKKLSV